MVIRLSNIFKGLDSDPAVRGLHLTIPAYNDNPGNGAGQWNPNQDGDRGCKCCLRECMVVVAMALQMTSMRGIAHEGKANTDRKAGTCGVEALEPI